MEAVKIRGTFRVPPPALKEGLQTFSLRTVSTRHLFAWIAAIVVIGVGGTAIALAAPGGGPVPPPKPLAVAAHDALAAPAPQGIAARVKFTNHLIDSTAVEGSDPILTGANGRLWITRGHFRLELQTDRGDAQVVADDQRFWIYDPSANTVYRGEVPPEWQHAQSQQKGHDVPSLDQVSNFIERLMKKADVSGAAPGDVAGRPVYTVRVSPKQKGGLLAAGELAWDALQGVPLRVSVFAKGNDSPVLELTATYVSYGSVPASDFDVSPPPDAKTVDISVPSKQRDTTNSAESAPVTGLDAVGKAVPFTLAAPTTLTGLPRNEVRLLDWDHKHAALITYGQDLGGIAVIEQPADSSKPGGTDSGSGVGGDQGGLTLPSVSIKGATAKELPTALGTVIRFERGEVAYTVVGSVPVAKAEAAARAL
jgi:outer membrane lipoprotein-sorting protein